ncbi:MAG: shikimate dehydrogenase [Streptosporangiaceae bacterium]
MGRQGCAADPTGLRSYVVGLIGSGVGSSLSPALHEREGARQGLSYAYRTIDIATLNLAPEAAGDLVDAARTLGFDGLNITHPCKQLVLGHLDELSADAEAMGAVNTIVFTDGTAVGHNTDVTGFARSFAQGLPDARTGTVVQLGAGGAGSAVAHALLRLGTDRLVLADADSKRAERLARTLRKRSEPGEVEHADLARLREVVANADGVVNATPLGMADHPGSAVPLELLRPDLWVADIVYRPLRTALVRAAEQAGCRVLTGAGMNIFQAVESFALITGRQPDQEAMFGDFEDLVALETAEEDRPQQGNR